MKILLILSVILLAIPNFFTTNLNDDAPGYNGWEAYEPALARLNSMETLTHYIDSLAGAGNIAAASMEYPILIEQVLKKRFYHGYSRFNLDDNWMAAVGEKLFGQALACTVYSNDILQYPHAACSQQAMVMMDLLKQKGIPCRHVAFQHHYALEAEINGQWYFFDSNMEPDISPNERAHHLWVTNTDYLKPFYKDRYSNEMLDYVFGKGMPATHGTTNEATAPNAKLFHTVTRPLSKCVWLLPILLFALYRKRFLSPRAVASSKNKNYHRGEPVFYLP